MASVSKTFNLGKSQAELDFVDVDVTKDTPLFIDPFALSRRRDRWSHEAHQTLSEFFQRVLDAIRSKNDNLARELLGYLQEPNETRLGLSKGKSQGAGIGHFQADELFDALKSSAAVQSGLIQSVGECELMIDGISWDKISDLTTNVIRKSLVDYTQAQCALLDIPMQSLPLPAYYDRTSGTWLDSYHDLPFAGGRPILFVPKGIARYSAAYSSHRYYSQYVIHFLQIQHIKANSSLVRTLRDGRKRVNKKDVEKQHPFSKKFLFEFSKQNPQVLAQYRHELAELEQRGLNATVGADDESTLANAQHDALKAIPAGNVDATRYQDLMLGILEFIFYPSLVHPRKEHAIHQGRKRIDIVFNNDASSGIFYWIENKLKLPCAYIVFECKNYKDDPANPELDQLLGRFSPNRGEVGFTCCRTIDNLDLYIERCRDAYKDRRGLVIPFEDELVASVLRHIAAGDRGKVDHVIQERIDRICMA